MTWRLLLARGSRSAKGFVAFFAAFLHAQNDNLLLTQQGRLRAHRRDPYGMGTAIRIEEELERILADPVFARSPVLARLLRYLVAQSAAGVSHLKSYTVAVEGLGRDPAFDANSDSYARVQVGRLRRALDAYYAALPDPPEHRLTLDGGSYLVRMVRQERRAVKRRTVLRRAEDRGVLFLRLGSAPMVWATILVIASTLLTALVLFERDRYLVATERWRTSDFPLVGVTVNHAANPALGSTEHAAYDQLMVYLSRYGSIRAVTGKSRSPDYVFHLHLNAVSGALVVDARIIDQRLGRVIWSRSSQVLRRADGSFALGPELNTMSFAAAQLSGVIHSNALRQQRDANTPYGCWLLFSARLQTSLTTPDKPLRQCVTAWHRAAPNHPLAAALRGWVLVDQSASQISNGRRLAMIAEALDIIETARTLHPDSAFLHLAAVRAYGVAQRPNAMRQAAWRAISANPGNSDIRGLVGVMLALRNEPQGEVLLDQAIASHFNPPRWYFLGKYTGAMMRDDPAGAARALAQMAGVRHALPIYPVLTAAVDARNGDLAQARAQWAEARRDQPVLLVSPDLYFSRLPISPSVRRRLRDWLKPVLAE